MVLFCSFLRHCCDAARKHEWERLLFKNENSRFETLLLVYPMRCVMVLNFLLLFSFIRSLEHGQFVPFLALSCGY